MDPLPSEQSTSAFPGRGERKRLSVKEKVGYSLGDAASNLYFQTFVVFLPIFYTDVLGLSAAAMGTMDAARGDVHGHQRAVRRADGRHHAELHEAHGGLLVPLRGGLCGETIIGATALTLVEYVGGGNEQLGWQYTMGAYGLLALALLLGTFFLTKERVEPGAAPTGNVFEDLGDLFKNKPWVLIGAATLFQLTYIVMRGSATPYYFHYFVGDQELALLGVNIALDYTVFTSSFLTVGTGATLVGATCTGFFSKRADKKTIYSSFLALSGVFAAVFFVLEPENVYLMYGLNIVVSFFFGSVSVLQWALYTDAADFGEWKFGRRATGLIMAASLFALKLGLTLGGSLVGWILSGYGFVEGSGAQAPGTLEGIRLLMTVYPAIFALIGGAIMVFYPMTDRMMVRIEDDLTARHAEAAA